MLSLTRLKELALFDFWNSLTNLKSLAFIIPYFFFWYLIFDNVSDMAAEWIQSTQGLFFASWLLDDQELALEMFVDRPASLSIYLLVSITITPFFILLAANNQYSSDSTSGAFRFILTRATRTELFLSRFIAVTLLVFICIFITSLWASLQAYMNVQETLEGTIIIGLQTFTLVMFYSLPFIAFMSMISAFTRSAFGCLFLGMMFYCFLFVISLWLKSDYDYASYLIPSGIKTTLIDIELEHMLISIAALSTYTLIYFGCGLFIFKQRDM
jgi:hypothetical protein